MRIMCGAAAIYLAASYGLLSQTAPPLSFEVATIKPAAPDARGMMLQFQPGGGLRATNLTLKQLIAFAYDVRAFQIEGGEGWVNSARYDIQARSERSADAIASPEDFRKMTDDQRKTVNEQMRERMRSLLGERFQVAIHRETKEGPIYALVVAKGGPKLQETKQAGGGRQGIMGRRRGQFSGTAAPLAMLTGVLSEQLGRPVIDRTGLTGKYDFELEWTPDSTPAGDGTGAPPPGFEAPPPPDPNGPTLFTAIQEQLGLRLESQKGPIEMVVIDRVERPSEN